MLDVVLEVETGGELKLVVAYVVVDNSLEKLCDKVAIIKNGRLVTSGDMDTVKGDASLEAVFLELEGEHA